MKIQKTIDTLKKLGFTEYEAKVYIALLQEHPLNGNSIAIKSGVPSPKIYETLQKMLDKGYVFTVYSSEKSASKHYSPLPYDDLINSIENEFLSDITLIKSSLNTITHSSNLNWTELFVIEGYEAALDTVKSSIKSSEEDIFLSCWNNELNKLYDSLLSAYNKGISVNTITFDQPTKDIPWKSIKHAESPVANKRHSDELSIVVDSKKAIVIELLHNKPHAVVSSHKALIKTTLNYIRHDMYVNKIINDIGQPIYDQYGKNLEKLLHDF